MRADPQSEDLYLSIQIDTSFFAFSGKDLVYMKLDNQFNLKWIYNIHGSTYPLVSFLSNYLSTNNYWQLLNIQTESTIMKYSVYRVFTSNGTVQNEQLWRISQPTTPSGQFLLNDNETLWLCSVRYTNDRTALLIGDTSTNTLLKKYYIGEKYIDTNVVMQQITGHIVIIAIDQMTKALKMIIYDSNSSGLVKAITINRKGTFTTDKLRVASNEGTIFFALEKSGFFSEAAYSRIVVFKTSDSLSIEQMSCTNTSSFSPQSLFGLTVTESSTSTISFYSPISQTLLASTFFPLVSQLSFVQSTNSDQKLYTMRDYASTGQCELQVLPEADQNIFIVPSGQINKNYNFPIPSFTDCIGDQYQIQNLISASNTYLSSLFYYDINNTFSVKITSHINFTGDFSLKFVVSRYSRTKDVYIKYRVLPTDIDVGNPSTSSHDITSCEESIYPFLYGFESDVFLEDMVLDEFGNLLLGGYGQKFPFGETGTGFNQGFISLQDQRGSRIWHLAVKFMPFNESTSCHSVAYLNSQTYAGCLVPSELFPGSVKFPHLLKISHTSGQVMFFKKIPNDNYDPSNQMFLAIESSVTSRVEVFYKSTSLNNQNSFVALSFNEETNVLNYFKFYNYLNYADFSSGNRIITDVSTLSFFVYRNQAANKVVIIRGSLYSGEINTEAKLLDVINADCLYCEPSLYGTDKILVPALSSSNGNFLMTYVLFRANLTVIKSLKIAFTSSYQLSSVSLSTDPFDNIYIQASQNVLYFAMIDSTFSLKYQRVWTGTGQTNFRAYALRSNYYSCSNDNVQKCASSEVYSAFQANLQQTGKLKDGFMIFRGTQADNCFDIPDINPANTTWLPTVNNHSSPLVHVQAISDISVDLPLKNTDNYPMIYEVFNYIVSNTRYGVSNDKFSWGEVELDNFYKRYPLQNFKCGMIARNKKYLHESPIREHTYKSGSFGLAASSLKKNCQDRNVNSQMLNPNTMSTTLNSVMALSFVNSGSAAFLLYLDKDVYFAQSFKIRYYDSVNPNTKYFYDHGLLIRYFPNYNISAPDFVHNVSACAQSPFPLGLHTSPYNVAVNNIAMNQTDLSFYLAGYLSVDNSYAANDESDRDDAFILKSSQSGAILWMNQINYQQGKNESGLGLATVNGFIYCSVNQTNQAYSSNMVSILKFTYNEGKLVWAKKIVVRNLIDGNTLYLSNIFDLASNPKNENQIMASVLYSWNQNIGQVPGNIMMYDNGTDLSSLYDYQYKSVGNQQSLTNPGQIFFDFYNDIVYLSALLNISGGYYQDIYVQAVYSGNGSQIWNFTQKTTQQCWVNLLQPALILNNKTNILYVGVQQSTTSVQIASVQKNTGQLNLSRLLRLSTGVSFFNMDMAADHKTGNIIVLGQCSSNQFEITILGSDLALIQGPTIMFNSYTPNGRVIGRYVAQTFDFFYAAFNAYQFSNDQTQSQIAILKKSMNPFEFQKYECQDFQSYTNNVNYYTSTVISQSSYLAPDGVNFFSNQTLWFSPDFQARVRMLNQFYTRVQFTTQTQSSPLVSGSKTAYCSSQSGRAGPQTYFPKSIEVSQGNIGIYNLISNDPSTQSCQGDNMTFSMIYDETFSETFVKSYMSKQISVAPWQIKIDATNSPPYPGVRWIAVQMSSNSKNDYSFLPVYVWPQVMPAATLEQNDPVCPDNDQQYPKIIGSDLGSGGVTFFSGDIDPYNGNAIMCGSTTNAKFQVVDYNNGKMNAWISHFDQNGVLAWQMAGISTNRTGSSEGAVYTSCAYGANFTGIFGTIFTIGDTYFNALVKHEYFSGKVLYITKIQGEYSQDYSNYNFFAIDKSANHIYFTAKRLDLRLNGALRWNNYIAKIDVSFTYPAQQYYMWATMSQMNQSTGVQAIVVSQSDDYLFSLMNHQTLSLQASTLGLFKKQTGEYVAQRTFRSQAYSENLYNFDIVYDGSSVYVGLCDGYDPKYFWVGKFSVPSLSYQAQVQHNLEDGLYYCRVTLGNDSSFLYAYNQESDYSNKYLTKIQKSDMSIKATTYFNDRQSFQSIQAKIFIFNQMLYLMMGNFGYTKSESAILHQFTLSLQSYKSCIETIPMIPRSTSYTFIYSDNLSSLIQFYKSSGQTFYSHFQKFYYEYLTDPNFARIYDSPMLKCKYYGPRFTNDMMTNVLEDQIIQLPVLDSYVYTFNWPYNCFNQEQDFSWSVDLYTTPPSFIKVTNTSSSSTFTLTPNNSNIGSYTVRVKFALRPMSSSFSEFTFVIEIYPEVTYIKPSVACPTSNILATFYKTYTYTEHLSMDMDASGESLIMCGRTKDPLLSRKTTYHSGFLSSFTQGLNLNFHLTIQLGVQTFDCQVLFGFENNIQAIYVHTAATSAPKDSIAFLKYSYKGQYLMGKHFSKYKSIDVNHYLIDLSNGDQYLSGTHEGSVFNKGSEEESFILKLDKDYRYVFMHTLESSRNGQFYQAIQGYQLKYTQTGLYQAFMFTHSKQYIGVSALSQQDLSISWVYGLFNFNSQSSNYLDFPTSEPPVALELVNSYLYLATCYYSVGSPAGYENYFIKINPTSGAIQDKIEWQLSTSSCSYHMSLKPATSNPNLIVLASGLPSEITLTLFNIGGSTISYRSNSLSLSYAPASSYFYSTTLFERNSTMWGFSRQAQSFAGSRENYGYLYKFKDYTNFAWDLPCSIQTSPSNYFSSQAAPNGYNGQFVASANWTDLRQFDFSNTYFTLGTGWSIPSRLFYRWYTNIQNMTSYPINNASSNQRIGLGTCKSQSAPTAPAVLNRLGAPINSTAGGFAVMLLEQNMILPQFLQCSGAVMTYSLEFKNGSIFTAGGLFSFDDQLLYISIFAQTNDFVGIHTLTYTAALKSDPSLTASVDFQIQIVKNQAPNPRLGFQNDTVMYARHSKTWIIQAGNDNENDIPCFNVRIFNNFNVDVNSTISWLYVNQSDDTGIIFSVIDPNQTLSNTTQDTKFIVQILVWDIFNVATPNTYNFTLLILPNFAPVINTGVNFNIGQIFITQRIYFTIWYQNFSDYEGDQVIIKTSMTTNNTLSDTSWLHVSVNDTVLGNITFQGRTPRDNDYIGTYYFNLEVEDQFANTVNQYQFYVNVYPKPQIQLIGSLDDKITQVPNQIQILFSNLSTDPLGEPYFYSLFINSTQYNSLTMGTWILWNNLTQNLTIDPYSNYVIGNHSVSIKFDDYISQAKYMNFTIQIIPNWPLVLIANQISNKVGIVDNWFYFHHKKEELFMNPEGNPFTMYFRQSQNENGLPYFVSKNYSNGTIGGFATLSDVGVYQMECVGVDDALWETVISFLLIIKPCYYKCQRCWDAEYNTCQSCKPGYFLYNSECVDLCIDRTYPDISLWSCLSCPLPCKTCTGRDETTQCSICTPGYFQLKNGCYIQCPDGYFGDQTDNTCKSCHSSCSLCYGPSSKQCKNCTELYSQNEKGEIQKIGYLLQATSCLIPKCIDGQYFSWLPELVNGVKQGRCLNCHARCKRCIGPYENQCLQCHPGALFNEEQHICTFCEEIQGLYKNEQFQCEDICGDGIIVNKQCDDGNLISGDGCSNLCQIEYGYSCKIPNTPCIEIIPPFFQIKAISKINQVFIQFSEPIMIRNSSDIGPNNLKIEILGSLRAYQFTWRMIQDNNNPLLPNRIITKFSLIIENYLQSMDGSELISISFKDSSVIKDLAGNSLPDKFYSTQNANPFIYLSEFEAMFALGSSTSIKYSFLSVFSLNLILKVALNSSMQYLWGLVHALQVFGFMLYMNIDFPENLKLFTQYFDVASGDLDEFNSYIPNIANYLIDEDNLIERSDESKLATPFLEEEISPYFLISYGQKITIWIFSLFIVLPSVLLLNKLCKKVKIWEEMKSSFFFNTPLRGFVEQYLEIIMQLIINTQFMKFKNTDQFITSAFGFIFTTASMTLPFLAMSIIYMNRKFIKTLQWKKKYGMLTEECQTDSILHMYYYPIFMYQRLMIAGIIVYFYQYPFIQCLLVMSCCAFMIGFLIQVRPFQEENQQTTTVLDEFVILICVILFAYLESNSETMAVDQKINLGWVIIFFISFSVIKNFCVVIYFGVTNARESLHSFFDQEDEQIDSLHTSDDEESIEINNKNQVSEDRALNTEELRKEVENEIKRKTDHQNY